VHDHDRGAAGLRYVYPVVSRRAKGLSIGINLNTNNACNWACRYCQVPDLRRGAAPAVDVALLAAELRGFLDQVLDGDFLAQRVPEGMRRVNDIAFSGNGEPTASPDFAAAVDQVLAELDRRAPPPALKLVVISNGSHVRDAAVLAAMSRLAARRGELWFKLDRGLAEGRRRVNEVELPDTLVVDRLLAASRVIPTWIQTCLFLEDGEAPGPEERAAYLGLLALARAQGARLAGVHLYTLARPSLQPGAEHLAALPAAQLEAWAADLRAAGLDTRVSA
jgi:pyruvate-formate lyase-activating enzyme